MGAKACRGIGGDNERWHANKILWDCNLKKELNLTIGEELHKSWNDVEDCVSGALGELSLTTLRVMWQAKPRPGVVYQPNICIGLRTLQSVQFNANDSRHYGRCRTLALSARYQDVNYEFAFAMSNSTITPAFHAFDAWSKRYKATRVFRETLVREMKMAKQTCGFITYHPEKLLREIPRVENIAASKKYNGKLYVTTHRLVWVSTRSSIINVSIPFIELRMVTTRSTPFGLGLVICASNVSLSNKSCHLRQGMRDGNDTIVLGFKFSAINLVHEVNRYCLQKQKEAADVPFYMPLDGKVIPRLGRWMVIDEETWREEMGLNDRIDLEEEEEDENDTIEELPLPPRNGALRSISLDGSNEEDQSNFDDPRTPNATPIESFDLGGDTSILADLATFEDTYSENENIERRTTAITEDENADKRDTADENKVTIKANNKIKDIVSPTAAAYRTKPTCVICLAKQPEIAFDPCGHFCSCSDCGDNLKECPMCREPITKNLKVFIVN